MTTLGLLLLGAAVGVLSAMMGIGGGIVLVPALMILFGLSQTEAQGTSLATIPFGAIIAAMIYHQSAPLRLHVIVAIAPGFVVGAYPGSEVGPSRSRGILAVGVRRPVALPRPPFRVRPAAVAPAGLVLAPLTVLVGWILRRCRPAHRHTNRQRIGTSTTFSSVLAGLSSESLALPSEYP